MCCICWLWCTLKQLHSWCFEPSQPHRVISGLVSWCFEPSQPQRVIAYQGQWLTTYWISRVRLYPIQSCGFKKEREREEKSTIFHCRGWWQMSANGIIQWKRHTTNCRLAGQSEVTTTKIMMTRRRKTTMKTVPPATIKLKPTLRGWTFEWI